MKEPNLTAWYAGLAIGTFAILAVVVLVAMVLSHARTLGAKSRDVARTLRHASHNTDALHEVVTINIEAHQINVLLADLRHHLDDVYSGGRQ